ncbi:MAG: hypothetical protein AB9866_05620 [Syntrophobacteraceae bacterium]
MVFSELKNYIPVRQMGTEHLTIPEEYTVGGQEPGNSFRKRAACVKGRIKKRESGKEEEDLTLPRRKETFFPI